MNLKIVAGISAGIFSTCGFCALGLAAAWWAYRPAGVPHVAPVQAVGVPVAKPMVYLLGQAVNVDGVFVRIVSAKIGTVHTIDLLGRDSRSPVVLSIELQTENKTHGFRVPAEMWRFEVRDEHGNNLMPAPIGVGLPATIDPGAKLTERIFVDRPIDAAKSVYIDLEVSRLGKGKRILRFHLDRTDIGVHE